MQICFIFKGELIYAFENREGMLDIANSCRTIPVIGDEFIWRGKVYLVERRQFDFPEKEVRIVLVKVSK